MFLDLYKIWFSVRDFVMVHVISDFIGWLTYNKN